MNNTYFKVGIYIRLSKEDENKNNFSESESVQNQRNLLNTYITQNGFTYIDEYIDDGFSGTTFDRPSFKKMLNDIEIGKINTVITKDLSRLGRDYIKSGYYLEQYFPIKKVRYISVLDNIDTFLDNVNNDIAPFKALFNDMQSKDTSKKIRSILRNKKEQGLFLGSSASYGYVKNPKNKHKLMIDPYASSIVKKIFDLASNNKSVNEICKILNDENIDPPSVYKYRKLNGIWSPSTIHNILKNRVYIGELVQCKQAKLNYKSKKRIILDRSNWIITKNAHEPIISESQFELVNKKNIVKRKTILQREKLLLEGLIFCKECGSLLSVKCDCRSNNVKYILNCNNYTKSPSKKFCKNHYIRYDYVENIVTNNVNRILEKINYEVVLEKLNSLKRKEHSVIDEQIEQKIKIKEIYNNYFSGKITKNECLSLIEFEEKKLKTTNKKSKMNKKYNFKELIKINRNLVNLLIDKVYIDVNKNIEIIYNFYL